MVTIACRGLDVDLGRRRILSGIDLDIFRPAPWWA